MTLWEALVTATFLHHALAAGILASLGCGVMGSFVVVKRIGFLAGGIAHAVLGGMGAAYYLGKNPLAGALIAALLAALLIGWVNQRWQEREDTLISALWSMGMAVGIIFISQTPGYNIDLMSYLFGNILMVSQEQLYLMIAVDAVIIFTVTLFYKQFLAISFDEEFARLRGVPVTFFYLLLLCMVALTVVLLIQIVGLILVIALLMLPAAIAGQYMRSLARMMLLAAILGTLFTSAGIVISYEPDFPVGPTIVLVAGGAYLFSTLSIGLRQHWRIRR
ncbi:ABC Mn2+/Zn2+ transporter inner membrane subunit [Candidatus Nitrosoglobus terrae]|uniref:ABC Mn2+/Zn2+ transporter inner membrane subunit n=1 Tax=Candidatus Nitrosoglobus terrae TaxID=1630141 RepID=A0A1Q2SP48_9GAMM|nr:metal ABC transporter permease [Candidatus Nitrosoglobus terrae]BAW80910.1 ABC Mn2+/Zn2+ transporter inner membrane subunit [Candidatus Nitrosoglobus terrae]